MYSVWSTARSLNSILEHVPLVDTDNKTDSVVSRRLAKAS